MERKDIMRIEPDKIICVLEVDDKEYCAFTNEKEPDYVNFGLISNVVDNVQVVTEIPECDLEKVLAEYDKYVEFMSSADELDDESGDE